MLPGNFPSLPGQLAAFSVWRASGPACSTWACATNGSLQDFSSKPTHWRPATASPASGFGDSSGANSFASDLAMATLFVFPQTNGTWILPTAPEEPPQARGSALPN